MRLKDNRDLQKFLQDGQEVNIHTHTNRRTHKDIAHIHSHYTHVIMYITCIYNK